MLKHLNIGPKSPKRVVILGANGFIGSRTKTLLESHEINHLSLTRDEIDLTSENSSANLLDLINENDTLVFISAKAPVKNEDMLLENLVMGRNVCRAIKTKPVSHLIYISSDAVYSDSDKPLTEASPAEPTSLHGVMHLAREVMLKNAYSGSLCVLRPTLIFGDQDPHNGYGPNSFLRLALTGKDLKLFGEGEERRDHIWIEDVCKIILKTILHKSTGTLNITSGTLLSFREIAEQVASSLNNNTKVITTPRSGPMPHNGYRAFDIANTKLAFPDFQFKNLNYWLEHSKLIKQEQASYVRS